MRINLTSVIILLVLLQASAKTYSQVTLHHKNISIQGVFLEIKQQTNLSFLYNSDDLNTDKMVSIDVNNASVDEVLKKCFKNLDVSYVIENQTVLIKRNSAIIVEAQSNNPPKEISGRITDKQGIALPNATIKLQRTQQGTLTDLDGKFILRNVQPEDVITITYTGYKPLQIKIGNSTVLNLVMEELNSTLEQVVVVGYGVQKRENLIGSVAQVTAKQLESRPVTLLQNAITGQMPGVTVTQTTGRPGVDNGAIRVRGVGSFGASPNPLILLDGTPIDNFNQIDPNDVASISVLKDASSAAIYGARAANGVILVTTKLGAQGKTVISYTGYAGFQKPTALPAMANSYEYAIAYNEAKPGTYSNEAIQKFQDGSDPDTYPNTNFLDQIITKSGFQTGHSISVSGGSSTNQYNLSLGNLYQDAIIIKNSNARYNARLNMVTNLSTKLKLTTRLSYIDNIRREPQSVTTIFDEAVRQPSVQVGIYSNGNYGEGITQIGTAISRLQRPAFYHQNDETLNGNLRMDYSVIDGLKLSFVSSYVKSNTFAESFAGTQTIGRTNQISLAPNSLSNRQDRGLYYTLQGLAEYNKNIGKHQINFLGGYSFENNTTSYFTASRTDFPNNDLTVLDLGGGVQQNAGSSSEYALESQFARLDYSYASKYLLELVARRDGSSRFPTTKKYAIFPSVAIGWRIGQEKFIKDNFSWISELKLKASRGVLGNQNIGDYPYQNSYGVVSGSLGSNYAFGGVLAQGITRTQLTDSTLHWESTRTTDAGIELGMFNNALYITATYFNRYTYDVLYPPSASVSKVLGFGLSNQNTGSLRNTGWEFTVNHSGSIGKFSYNINTNFSIINNKVLDLGVGNVNQPNGMVGNGSSLFIGYPMGIYYGYVADGLYVDAADVAAYKTTADQTAVNAAPKPGDIRYKDISGPNGIPDGKVDATYDRVVLGSTIPKYTYGINIGLKYGGFDVSTLLQGVAGVKGYLSGMFGWAFYNAASIQQWQYDERWTTANPNPNAGYPRVETFATAGTGNYTTNSFWVINGSYLRIKNAQIGYTLPKKWINSLKITNARLYLSGENLHTYSNYRKGWDPEISGQDTYYPILANYTIGVNVTF